jgi:hypothetical protein
VAGGVRRPSGTSVGTPPPAGRPPAARTHSRGAISVPPVCSLEGLLPGRHRSGRSLWAPGGRYGELCQHFGGRPG